MKCKKCGWECHPTDQECSYCGTVLNQKSKHRWFVAIIVMSLVTATLILGITGARIYNRVIDQQIEIAITAAREGDVRQAKDTFLQLESKRKSQISEFIVNHIDWLCDENRHEEAFSWVNFLERYVSQENIEKMSKEIAYRRGEYYVEIGDYSQAYNQFKGLKNYKDSVNKRKEVWNANKEYFYQIAINKYNTGSDIVYAENLFKMLGSYADSAEYVEEIDFLQSMTGTYKRPATIIYDTFYTIDFRNINTYEEGCDTKTNKITVVNYNDGKGIFAQTNTDKGIIIYKEGESVYSKSAVINEDGSIKEYGSYNSPRRIYRISKKTSPVRAPYIGMSREDLELSLWGSPKKINKTTYSWGVKEQWVYEGYRYVYVEDGEVTAIQE